MTPADDSSTDPDASLWRRLRRGDEAAVMELYRERAAVLLRFLVRLTGSPALAEDVLHDVFLAVLDGGAGGYDPARGSLRSYLFGAARNVAAKRFRPPPAPPPAATEGVGQRADDDEQSVRAALLQVAPEFREVLLLCDLEGLRYDEAAAALAIPIGTVRSRLSRARAQMASLLTDQPAAADPAARKEAR
jgi:RNA polymerase sigma factor (sigma-70 family)